MTGATATAPTGVGTRRSRLGGGLGPRSHPMSLFHQLAAALCF